MPKCLVCGNSPASTTRRDITYHMFPKNENQRREWLNVYGIDHCDNSHRICSDHFLNENYRPGRKRYLKKNSTPHGYDKKCFLSNRTQSNDVVMSNNELLPTELNRLSYTTQSNDDEGSTNEFLPREEDHLIYYTTLGSDDEISTDEFLPREENHLNINVQSYENITRFQTEPLERQIPTCIANDNIQTVIESVLAPVLTTSKIKQEATSTLKFPDKLSSNAVTNPELIDGQITFSKHNSSTNKSNLCVFPEIKTPVISECFSLAGMSDTHYSNPDNGTNTSQCIIIDDDDAENVTVKDQRFIYNISRIIVLPSEFWTSSYDCVHNTTSFCQLDSSYKTVKKIAFYNSLLPKIQICGMDYKYNKPIKSKNELQSLLKKVEGIERSSGIDGFTNTYR